MRLKTENGEMNVPSQAQGTINTVLGAIGAFGALTMGGGLLGQRGANQSSTRGESDGDRPVTRYEMSLMQENTRQAIEIAELKARINADEKLNAAVKSQMEFNAEQMVYNASANSMMRGLQEQTKQLQGMTKMVIPQANVVDVKTSTASATNTQTGD